MNDPIVDEVRRVRDAHAARFNYDLDAIFEDIKEREKKSGLTFVDGSKRVILRPRTDGAIHWLLDGNPAIRCRPGATQSGTVERSRTRVEE